MTKVPARPASRACSVRCSKSSSTARRRGIRRPAAPVAAAGRVRLHRSARRPAIPEAPRLDLHARPLPHGLVRRRQLEAYGQDLVHEQAAEKTTLTGAPLYAVQQRNVLTAGGAKNPAVLVIEPAPAAPGAHPRPARTNGATRPPSAGRAGSRCSTPWRRRTRPPRPGRRRWCRPRSASTTSDVDLFTLTDAARFEDTRADYWLKGNVLKLWLKPARDAGRGAGGGQFARRCRTASRPSARSAATPRTWTSSRPIT